MPLRHLLLVLTVAFLGACRRDAGSASVAANREPSTTKTESAVLTTAAANGAIETVNVEGDRPVLVVIGDAAHAKQPIVHFHGMCTEAKSDLEAWSSSVRTYGTIIALEGDSACTGAMGGRTWSQDSRAHDRRIGAAIAAVRAARNVELDDKEVILVGESMGATRAIALATTFPDRYQRLVLVGAPEKLQPTSAPNVKAVAVLAGEKEPQEIPKQNLEGFRNAGKDAKYWTLAGANHGDYGTNGAATMNEALAFVTK